MWLRSWVTVSESVGSLRGGVVGVVVVLAVVEMEKLSSDKQTLWRRNAAVAIRLPVCSRAMASSISPRWQQACPRIMYLNLHKQFFKIFFYFHCCEVNFF
jgi:hypothetical protein